MESGFGKEELLTILYHVEECLGVHVLYVVLDACGCLDTVHFDCPRNRRTNRDPAIAGVAGECVGLDSRSRVLRVGVYLQGLKS